MYYNKLHIVGRLTGDPENKKVEVRGEEKFISEFTVAVNRSFSNISNETDFFNVVCWDKQALLASDILKKGNLVLIDGELKIESYKRKVEIKKEVVEINAVSHTLKCATFRKLEAKAN